jgi:hypothetical protein
MPKALVCQGTINPWTSKIIHAWHSTLEGFFECGRLLIQARDDLDHGEFLAMVKKDLPFGPRYAQMLMRVAADPRLTKTKHVSFLPPSPATLYQLSRLDDVTFRRALARGDIHADMDRAAAGALLDKHRRTTRARRAAQQNIGRREISLWLIDPPWPVPGVPYDTLSLDQLWSMRLSPDGNASKNPKWLTVAEASAPCAACAVWAIDDRYASEIEFMMQYDWGFEPLQPWLVWAKPGHGHASQAALLQHEYLIIGAQGGATPVWLPKSVMTFKRASRDHSSKPQGVHKMLERMFPNLKSRMELFARQRIPGWRGWGNQYPAE